MTKAQKLQLWAPRLIGIGVALSLGVFALDAVDQGVGALLIHLLPTVVLLIVVALAWRREWIGSVVFVGLALLYIMQVRGRLDWTLAIAAPLLLVGVMFLINWRNRGALHPAG